MLDMLDHPPANNNVPPVKDVPPAESNALGIEFAMELGTIIAIPAVVFGIAGQALDKHYGTNHLIFFIALALAFVSSFLTIYKKVREIMARMPKIQPKKRKQHVDPDTAREQEVIHDLFRPPSE